MLSVCKNGFGNFFTRVTRRSWFCRGVQSAGVSNVSVGQGPHAPGSSHARVLDGAMTSNTNAGPQANDWPLESVRWPSRMANCKTWALIRSWSLPMFIAIITLWYQAGNYQMVSSISSENNHHVQIAARRDDCHDYYGKPIVWSWYFVYWLSRQSLTTNPV